MAPSETDRKPERLGRLAALREAIDEGAVRSAERMINTLHPAEIAQLLESLPRFRGESALSTWAFTVARRTCALRKRRATRYASLEGRAGRPARGCP